jgi:mono/diheme cytochrome c family protein
LAPDDAQVVRPDLHPDASLPTSSDAGRDAPTADSGLTSVAPGSATPALISGTVLVTHDDRFFVLGDPERDTVVVTSPTSFVGEINLAERDEPGRAIEDAAGRVHVVLRRGGAIVTIDPATATALDRRPVCPAPRGIAYDSVSDALLVVCASGELVTMPSSGGSSSAHVIDDDLRDVVLADGVIYVSRFRSAEVLVIDPRTFAIVRRVEPPMITAPVSAVPRRPGVAWRMVARSTGGVLLLHQQARTDSLGGTMLTSVPAPPAYYMEAASGSPLIVPVMTVIDGPQAAPWNIVVGFDPLVVDVAMSPTLGPVVALAGASAGAILETDQHRSIATPGRAVAVAFLHASGTPVVQMRGPRAVLVADGMHTPLTLGASMPPDEGFELFHTARSNSVACASCHPEGGDDGHVWNFGPELGVRRTMAPRGGIVGTEPFHWGGEDATFEGLMVDVFDQRMGNGSHTAEQLIAMAQWVDSNALLPARTIADAAAVVRGRALFDDPSVGCSSCHSGPRLSNQTTVDVGTGGSFQVPMLTGVSYRAPYMHDGCAGTLRDRLSGPASCTGGDAHGHTSQLTSAQVDDLVAYLSTL